MTYRDTTGPKPRAPRSLARNRLTAAFVRSVVHQGRCKRAERYHDGGGLYLQVMPGNNSKQWVQRLALNGTQYYYGLGGFPEFSLAEARDRAEENTIAARRYRRAVARGGTAPLPVFEAQRRATMARRRNEPVPVEVAAAAGATFAEVFERCIEERARDWKNPRTDLRSWRADLRTHLAALAPLPVEAVTVDHLRGVMDRVASRATRDKALRRCGTVFAFAEAGGYRPDNPARKLRASWSGLKRPEPVHRKALAHAEVPAFFARLAAGGVGADARGALALLVLTGLRSKEARLARGEEMDLREEAPTWTVPASRMKDGREHRVPLSRAALAVLRAAGAQRSGLVFRSPRGREVSDKALRKLLADLGAASSVHGFRSSMRGWASAHGVAREVAEACLGHHAGKSRVEQAYDRGDLLERRRVEVMEPWGAFVAGGAR